MNKNNNFFIFKAIVFFSFFLGNSRAIDSKELIVSKFKRPSATVQCTLIVKKELSKLWAVLKIKNAGEAPIELYKGYFPVSGRLNWPLFVVEKENEDVGYQGAILNDRCFRAYKTDDFILLPAGKSFRYKVELLQHYEMKNGSYRIQFQSGAEIHSGKSKLDFDIISNVVKVTLN